MVMDVFYSKIASIERGLRRVNEVYDKNLNNLEDYTKQDSIILNIQRACECSIDIAIHIISEKNLRIPQTSKEAFEILQDNKIINKDLANKMKYMVEFRNVALHNYQEINSNVVISVIENKISNFNEYIYAINKMN